MDAQAMLFRVCQLINMYDLTAVMDEALDVWIDPDTATYRDVQADKLELEAIVDAVIPAGEPLIFKDEDERGSG